MIPLVNPALARQNSAVVQPWLGGAVRWIVVVLAAVAVADAAYLTWTSFTHGVVAGCSGLTVGGCDEVLTSRWSRAAGLPVALGGLLCYGAILGLALAAGSRGFNSNRWLGTMLAAAALLAALSGLYFTVLQMFVLGAFCYYCLGTHLCGLVIAGLVLWSALRNRPESVAASRSHVAMAAIPGARRAPGPRPAARPSLAAAVSAAIVALVALTTIQWAFPAKTFETSQPKLNETIDMTARNDAPPADESDELSPQAQPHVVNRPNDETVADDAKGRESSDKRPETTAADGGGKSTVAADEKPAETADAAPKLSREVTFLNGKLKLDTYNEPLLGSPDAKYVVVEMIDYTCPHCRKMHAHIRDAMYRYGDQLAIIILPVPLELECNKLVPATDPIHRGSCKIAATALAVAEVEPHAFLDFHNYLLADEDKPPTSSQAVFRAFAMVDRNEFRRVSRSKEISDRIQQNIRLYATLSAQQRDKKSFGLPVQLVGDTVLSGGEITSEEMFEAWEKALGIKPQ